MLSSPVLSVILVLAFVASATLAYPADDQTIPEVINFYDLSTLKDLSQGAELIPLSQERVTKGAIRYTFGQRAKNDIFVSQTSDMGYWGLPMNVKERLVYPTKGTGARITYVEIDVNQSSNIGKAYITSGGIGQRSIVIIVEATSTTYFTYTFKVYGIES